MAKEETTSCGQGKRKFCLAASPRGGSGGKPIWVGDRKERPGRARRKIRAAKLLFVLLYKDDGVNLWRKEKRKKSRLEEEGKILQIREKTLFHENLLVIQGGEKRKGKETRDLRMESGPESFGKTSFGEGQIASRKKIAERVLEKKEEREIKKRKGQKALAFDRGEKEKGRNGGTLTSNLQTPS